MNNKILTTPFKKNENPKVRKYQIRSNKINTLLAKQTHENKHRINQITHTHFIATCIRQNI